MNNVSKDREKETTIFVVITMGVMIIWTIISAILKSGWGTAAIGFFGIYVVLVAYSFIKDDNQLQAYLLFATIAGFIELFADDWVVHAVNSLVYPPEPLFVASPCLYAFCLGYGPDPIGLRGELFYQTL